MIAFSATFSPLDPAATRAANVPHYPTRFEINVLSNIVEADITVGGPGNSELLGHQDMAYERIPPMANVLSGIETPKTGADTLFYNLHLAYKNRSLGHHERLKNLF